MTVEEQFRVYRSPISRARPRIRSEAVADLEALLASHQFRFTTGDILTLDSGLPKRSRGKFRS